MTTTIDDDTAAIHQNLLRNIHSTIHNLMHMYPATDCSLEEAMVVREALADIALWRQRGIRREGLEKAAADIAARDRMRALVVEEAQTKRRAAGAQCDLCDEEGRVLGRDGKQVLDADGYEIDCDHGRPVDLDDDED
jgi:hypothetical protein